MSYWYQFCEKTSRPAPRILPSCNALRSSSSSITPPRHVEITNALGFITGNSSRPSNPLVSAVNGTCRLTKSHSAKPVSSSVTGSTLFWLQVCCRYLWIMNGHSHSQGASLGARARPTLPKPTSNKVFPNRSIPAILVRKPQSAGSRRTIIGHHLLGQG